MADSPFPRTVRESQQRTFETTAAFLAGLSDNDLSGVSYTISMARIDAREREGSYSPVVEAVGREFKSLRAYCCDPC